MSIYQQIGDKNKNVVGEGSMWNVVINGGMIKNDICFPSYFTKILFSIIFPPIGVGIDEHEKGYPNITRIIIAFILTMLFWIPGVIYALSTNKLAYISPGK